MNKVTFVQGGGVGLDQESAVRKLFTKLDVPIEFDTHYAGRAALDRGQTALPDSLMESLQETGLALKTKLLQPAGSTMPTPHNLDAPMNYNVQFRKKLGLHTSIRPVRNLAGIPSRFKDVNFLLVREISEDLYTASEHEVTPGVVQSFKIVTEKASLRFFRIAFELARANGRTLVHCIHKANILKLADGLYLECFRTIAKDFPDIEAKDMIVDNACMQMVSKPTQFQVVAAGNMYGDLLADLGAGLVGGIAATMAINIGEGRRVYEAVYGAGYDQIAPDRATPIPLILPAIEMLKELGEVEAGQRLFDALIAVLDDKETLTEDLGGQAGTDEFADAICAKL